MWAASLLVLSAGTSALSAGLKPDLRYVSPPATDDSASNTSETTASTDTV